MRLDYGDYLRRGARNGQVKTVQCLLKRRMYDGRLHGRCTKATWRGVRTFQRSRGVERTGVVTKALWADLKAGRR